MENDNTLGAKDESCPSCADNTVKRVRANEHMQIVVPSDSAMDRPGQFTAAQENEIAQILAGRNLRYSGESAPFPGQAEPQFATMRPMAPEAPTIDSPSRIPTGSFTLAETAAAEVIPGGMHDRQLLVSFELVELRDFWPMLLLSSFDPSSLKLPPLPRPPNPRDPADIARWTSELAQWLAQLAQLIRDSRHALNARSWAATQLLRPVDLPANASDYTEPPEIYPASDCPETYHNHVDFVSTHDVLETQSIAIAWTLRMQANWEDNGDPYVTSIPAPTDAELDARYPDGAPKPDAQAIRTMTSGFAAALEFYKDQLAASGYLPDSMAIALQAQAENAAGQCPARCPNRAVTVAGQDLEVGYDVAEQDITVEYVDSDGDGNGDTWQGKVTVYLRVTYKGRLYFDVTCSA